MYGLGKYVLNVEFSIVFIFYLMYHTSIRINIGKYQLNVIMCVCVLPHVKLELKANDHTKNGVSQVSTIEWCELIPQSLFYPLVTFSAHHFHLLVLISIYITTYNVLGFLPHRYYMYLPLCILLQCHAYMRKKLSVILYF